MGHVSDEHEHDADEPGRRHAHGLSEKVGTTVKRRAFATLLVVVAGVTTALGVWQLERRTWKLDLIRAVDARAHSSPVPAPGPVRWPSIDAERDAYRHLKVAGRFDYPHEMRVWAVTGRGEGNWLVTPLRTVDGWTVLVNRGFVPAGETQISRPTGIVALTGLLRMTEPGGTFLRSNDPAAGRWFSRDVAAMARSSRLTGVAPYFIDADGAPGDEQFPTGGLTVITFRNAHLSYAFTWFALAALSLLGLWLVLRRQGAEERN